MTPKVLLTIKNSIATITLNEPETLNAINVPMGEAFGKVLDEIEARSDIRVVILTGAGRAFSSGGNLDMLEGMMGKEELVNKKQLINFYKSFLRLRDLSVPVIAAINGPAIGAGFCFTLASDLRYAATNAKLGANFAKIGLAPGMGGTWLITQLAGISNASELMLLADAITAAKAKDMNLVNDVFESDSLLPEVEKIAQKIASNGPVAIRMIKKGIQKAIHSSLEEMFEYDSESQAKCFLTSDIREGIKSVREKRVPRFKGK